MKQDKEDNMEKKDIESDKDEQIKQLKTMVIYLAGVYQSNFDRFASSSNYSYEVKEKLSEDAFENIYKVFMHFHTVQGSQYRDLVEELSSLELPMKSFNVDQFRCLFGYDRTEVRKKLYQKNFSEEAKAKKLIELKELWETKGNES